MLDYDITQPPPSRQELDAEKSQFTVLKKQQIKASIISDGCHGVLLLTLYLTNLLSGFGLLVAMITATTVAIALASSSRKQLDSSDVAVVALASLATVASVVGISVWMLQEILIGAILAGLVSGSIVTAGAIIGRKFFHVFIGLEQLKNVAEDDLAIQELQTLCRNHPALDDYRQQARDILRPNLTFGELQAMRDWVAEKTSH